MSGNLTLLQGSLFVLALFPWFQTASNAAQTQVIRPLVWILVSLDLNHAKQYITIWGGCLI